MGYNVQEKSLETFRETKHESLSNWVRNVKKKSVNAKTKKKRDFRIIAILSNSLSRAESELLVKQKERARKWALMQERLEARPVTSNDDAELAKREREKIDNLWKTDLRGLDDFFKELDKVKPILIDR